MFDVLQHSDSEGASPGMRQGREEEEEEEVVEELGSRQDSLERLICSEEEEEEEAGRLSPQRSHQMPAEDSEPDEILLEDQVDDFASSVLAAISCWHYRAQALLSTGVTMVMVRLSAASLVFFIFPPTFGRLPSTRPAP